MSVVGDNIQKRRKELGLSQVELSARSGISQAGISDIERGKKSRTPNTDTISKLAAALRCSVSELMGEEEFQPATPDDLDDALVRMMMDLSPDEAQRVRDFVSGLIAARKV